MVSSSLWATNAGHRPSFRCNTSPMIEVWNRKGRGPPDGGRLARRFASMDLRTALARLTRPERRSAGRIARMRVSTSRFGKRHSRLRCPHADAYRPFASRQLPRIEAETAAKSAKIPTKPLGTAEHAVAPSLAATHIPQSENICSQYDNDAGRGAKLGLSRAAQRIGFALWVIAYGALARHPSPSVTGSH